MSNSANRNAPPHQDQIQTDRIRADQVQPDQVQPGYDAMATLYAALFPAAATTPLELMVLDGFAESVQRAGLGQRTGEGNAVLDVGCGTGTPAAHLVARGLSVVGVDPSEEMLAFARERLPDQEWIHDDAWLGRLGQREFDALLARFSLIHIDPAAVPAVVAGWADRTRVGGPVLVGFQCLDPADPASNPAINPGARPYLEFDHKVARAWLWHPDALAGVFEEAGFAEVWRTVSRPDAAHRFTECHLLLVRR